MRKKEPPSQLRAAPVSALATPTDPIPAESDPRNDGPATSADDLLDDIPAAISMLNDDETPMDLVEHILEEVFGHSAGIARELMMAVHEHGSAVVAVRPSPEAERLLRRAIEMARTAGAPLKFDLRDAESDETERAIET